VKPRLQSLSRLLLPRRPSDNPRELEGIQLKAIPQILHLGKQRLDTEKLTSSESLAKAHSWIESNVTKFITSLPEP
jgi:hypothetical protein